MSVKLWFSKIPDCKTIQPKFRTLLLTLMLITFGGGCAGYNTGAESNNNLTKQQIVKQKNHLAIVKDRGHLICGVNGQLAGFSSIDRHGNYSGMDADLCRAIATAIFNDPSKIEFHNLSAEERFAAVKSGQVDLLSRNTTWTLSRDTADGMEFTPTIFFDGQGLLVGEASNIRKLEDLNGKFICVISGTTSEQNLTKLERKQMLNFTPVVYENADLLFAAYESKNCDAATSDRSQLVTRRAGLTNPNAHKVLDLVFSKEPLGPLVANGQTQWFDLVKWVTYALIRAEELGISSQNIDSFSQSKNPEIKRFLGIEGKLGEKLGLSNDFAAKVIQHVGNYGEVYQRNIGKPFGLERGLNALSKDGGLMYSPPFR